MNWFYQLPDIETLASTESFFHYFRLDYDAQALLGRSVLLMREFRARLEIAIPLRNTLERSNDADWQLARRLLAESYQAVCRQSDVPQQESAV